MATLQNSPFINDVLMASDANGKDTRDKKIIFLRGYVGPAYKYDDNKNIEAEITEKVSSDSDSLLKKYRVYLSPDLNSYIEINGKDVIKASAITSNELGGYNIWLYGDADLTYGGLGYEINKTNHYFDEGVVEAYNNNFGGAGRTPMNCNTQTATCPSNCSTKGCGPPTPTCPRNCDAVTQQCGGASGVPDCPLPTGAICNKYSTVIGCDEWDFRKNYRPY